MRELIRQIQSDRLAVGDRLPSIRDLSARLGASISAVRDALMQAQTLGLVKVRPRSGAFVQSLTYGPLVDALTGTLEAALVQVDHNLFHLLEARQWIEVELVGLAASRRRLEDLLPVRDALDAMAAGNGDEGWPSYVEADVRFHVQIARIAGNPVLTTTLEAMLGLLRPYLVRLPWTPERRERADRSHVEIYQALLAGDPA
ncbi:MAG TPA: FCD domain-containing protein, partial [Pirellulales bacterium]|nr:FCD domain-containing protein [Pirellulales bacterium]